MIAPNLCDTAGERRIEAMAETSTRKLVRDESPTAPSTAPFTLSGEAVLDALKMILISAPLSEVLTSVTRLIETQRPGMLCSIFLLDADGVHLRYAAAPSLPESYRAATDGLAYGPNVGSCGTAVYRREAVFVPDILSDPLWVNFRKFATAAGLRAAWSSPIISNDGRVLGTFGMYYREVHNPTSDDIRLIEHASRIAAIAIEREQSQTALKGAFERIEKSEAALREIVDAIRHDVVVLGADGSVIYVNRSVLELIGLSEREAMETDFRSRAFHPEDLKRLGEVRKAGFSGNIPWENEVRVRRNDGQYRWFLIRYSPLFDEQGKVRKWCAAGLDIEDRKRDEERLRRENLALREDFDLSSMYEEIVGSSRPLRSVLSQVGKVAPTDSTVLIYGETGTGKELVARAIHKRSNRSASAFIKVNCAAIPPSLIASELFGHEKGAFTGAVERRIGRFEAADGGTIFLDEVGELLPETQVSLLRVLQERELERVGSNRPIRINVRVLAATNRDLEASVEEGTFRSDLFYRLNVFPLRVPSLRERRDDIPMLVEYLVERYTKRSGKRIRNTSKESLALLQSYDWPGNIRELQNVIERAVILCDGEMLSVDETWLRGARKASHTGSRLGPLSVSEKEFVQREREAIEAALAECDGRISGPHGAAFLLGIPRQTLDSKIEALGIAKHHFKPARKG
jgi:formate hydrogenlyase transcriptional activator